LKYLCGQRVVHPLFGIGVVEKIEQKEVMGTTSRFGIISFQNDRLKYMVNLDQKNNMIRNLIHKDEVPKVFEFMRTCKSGMPVKSSERYSVNMKKIKTADIYQLAEVLKDLSELSKIKKLSPKEKDMLKQYRKLMAAEFSCVTEETPEHLEQMIDNTCR